MTLNEFEQYLIDNNYGYTREGNCLSVTYHKMVYFNGVYASDSINIYGLTTLPEGVKFNNRGLVRLNGLTTLPEDVEFDNSGPVKLRSLTSEHQTYRGKRIRLMHVDGHTTLITSARQLGDVTLFRARYFGGGDLDKLRRCYVARQGDHSAHGDTPECAMRDLRFKIAQADFEPSELVAEIKARGEIAFNEYRLLTGACKSGLQYGLEALGLSPDTEALPLDQALTLSRGQYGGVRFAQLMKKETAQ